MSKTREDFETINSGLFDDFDGKTIGSRFGNPTGKYSENLTSEAEPGLYLTFENPEAEKPIEQFFTIGKGWKIINDGKAVENIAKPELHGFNKSSKAAKIVDHLAKVIGNGDAEKGKEFYITRDFYMTQAEFYLGWNAHWKNEESKMTVEGSEKIIKTLLPIKWYGEVKSGQTAPPAQQTQSGTQVPPPAGSSTSNAPSGNVTTLDEMVIKLTGGKDEKGVKLAALGNKELKEAVAKINPGYMKDLVSGVVLKRLESEGKLFKDDKGLYLAF
jgi:hypothetical protein